MPSIVNALINFGPWAWFILATALFILETVVPGVHFVWFSVAAGLVGTAAIVLTSVSPETAAMFTWPMQIVAFALTSVATVFWVRRYSEPSATQSDLPNLNERAEQYVGRSFPVAVAISNGRGKIRIGDTLWLAEGPDTAVGQLVTVVDARGTVLAVTGDAA